MEPACAHVERRDGVCVACGDCAHLERQEGVCVACGDCTHDVILNGACLACGSTAIDPVARSPRPARVVPVARLRRGPPR